MKNLIEAFQIFSKYTDCFFPTRCDYEELYVKVSPEDVSQKDIDRLEELGFEPTEDNEEFVSIEYGSY